MQPIAHGTPRTQQLCCWPECFAPVENPDVPLCEAHYRVAGMAWIGDNIELLRGVTEALPQEVMFDRVRREADVRRARARVVERAEGVVYYIRVGDQVKIGTTTNLRERMIALRVDGSDLLATEPGGYDVERRRHHEFADERYGRRENFALSDRLAAHIERLRAAGR